MATLSGRAPGRTRRIRVPIGAEPPPDHSEQPDLNFLGCSSAVCRLIPLDIPQVMMFIFSYKD